MNSGAFFVSHCQIHLNTYFALSKAHDKNNHQHKSVKMKYIQTNILWAKNKPNNFRSISQVSE